MENAYYVLQESFTFFRVKIAALIFFNPGLNLTSLGTTLSRPLDSVSMTKLAPVIHSMENFITAVWFDFFIDEFWRFNIG